MCWKLEWNQIMDKEKQGENEDQCLGEKGFRDFMGGYSATRRLLLL